MKAPPWQPPNAPAFTPFPTPSIAPAPVGRGLLRAPLWGPQDDESPAEHRAFLAWLMGGYVVRTRGHDEDPSLGTRGDWAGAAGLLGLPSSAVHAIALKWSWDVRGREYWLAMRAINERAAKAHEESVLEYAALARALDREWLELQILEVRKARAIADRRTPEPGQENDLEFLPRLFDNREMIAAYRATGGLEVQRFRAGVLERAAKDAGSGEGVTDFGKLPPADLESYRLLREKARQGT